MKKKLGLHYLVRHLMLNIIMKNIQLIQNLKLFKVLLLLRKNKVYKHKIFNFHRKCILSKTFCNPQLLDSLPQIIWTNGLIILKYQVHYCKVKKNIKQSIFKEKIHLICKILTILNNLKLKIKYWNKEVHTTNNIKNKIRETDRT